MVDELALRQIFSLESATWTIALLLMLFLVRMWNGAPAMFAQWVAWRRSVAEARIAEAGRLAAEKASDWSRLRDEIARLSDAERKCREDFDVLHDRFIANEVAHSKEIGLLRSEIAELRGFMTGQGSARQEAAGIVAIERRDRHSPEEPRDP
jgi:hypothetical protein